MQFFKSANIDFVGKRKMGFIMSASVILIGLISLVMHGGPRYNIDFTGGALIDLKFDKPVEIEAVRSAVSGTGLADSEIKYFGEQTDIVIRAGVEHQSEEIALRLENAIEKAMPDNPFTVMRVEKVGPKIGKELIMNAIKAIVWAIVLILIYVMWRFEAKFAFGAILALIHDVTITIGVFSLLDIEISAPIIAAVLTIVGYSLNDTIVVFDRIRENTRVKQKNAEMFMGTVNRSLNETLSRTIITSLTTLFVVAVLFVFGGEVLRSFALALIIGIVVGTYSSLFIASPFIIEWQLKTEHA